VLLDNSLLSIKGTAEFNTNLKPESYANQFITSVFSKERLLFFIRYGIAYVDSPRDGLQKHIIRYPQYFAATELVEKLKTWNEAWNYMAYTRFWQNSTCLLCCKCLRDYYQEKTCHYKVLFRCG
jgi:type I restriction enzyme, R subunit